MQKRSTKCSVHVTSSLTRQCHSQDNVTTTQYRSREGLHGYKRDLYHAGQTKANP
jgi:hypothetical protein